MAELRQTSVNTYHSVHLPMINCPLNLSFKIAGLYVYSCFTLTKLTLSEAYAEYMSEEEDEESFVGKCH